MFFKASHFAKHLINLFFTHLLSILYPWKEEGVGWAVPGCGKIVTGLHFSQGHWKPGQAFWKTLSPVPFWPWPPNWPWSQTISPPSPSPTPTPCYHAWWRGWNLQHLCAAKLIKVVIALSKFWKQCLLKVWSHDLIYSCFFFAILSFKSSKSSF